MRYFGRLMGRLLLVLVTLSPAVSAQDETPPYSQAELDQMLAPVALYPDSVLAQMLMAATYPLEIIEAAEWSRDNPDLNGDAAVAAVEEMDWDPSVKAMVAFPNIMDRMERDLDWTTHLGDAFLRQEEQVLATVQDLRQRAYAEGNLVTSDNIRVYREPDVIIIEPVHPRIVYVPYYDPWRVYGHWWWPSHPPVHWAHPLGYHHHSGFYWGSGINFSLTFFYSNFDWHGRHAVVHHHHDRPFRHRLRPGKPLYKHADFGKHYRKWQHDGGRRHHLAKRRHPDSGKVHKFRTRQTTHRFDGHGNQRKTAKPLHIKQQDKIHQKHDRLQRPAIRNHVDRFRDDHRLAQKRNLKKYHDSRRLPAAAARTHRRDSQRSHSRRQLDDNRAIAERLIRRDRSRQHTFGGYDSRRNRAVSENRSRQSHRQHDAGDLRHSEYRRHSLRLDPADKRTVRPTRGREYSGYRDGLRRHETSRRHGSGSHKGAHQFSGHGRSSSGKGVSRRLKGGGNALQAPVSSHALGNR